MPKSSDSRVPSMKWCRLMPTVGPPCPQTPIRKSKPVQVFIEKIHLSGELWYSNRVVQGRLHAEGSETKCGSFCCALSTSCPRRASLLAVQVHPFRTCAFTNMGAPQGTFGTAWRHFWLSHLGVASSG